MTEDNGVVHKTVLRGLKLLNRGKVRDIYDLGDKLLMISSDRLSAFDVILNEGIPDKGRILTSMTEFWLEHLKDIVPNHLVSADVNEFPKVCPKYADVLLDHANVLAGRSMIVKKAEPIEAECIVRGYITGSGWNDYKKTGSICGIEIAPGMKESEIFIEPLFTPSTKAAVGDHDENVSISQIGDIIGKETAEKLRDISIAIYERARNIARERDIIIADTKLEFGMYDGEIILIDEVLTPDSSRFWPLDGYAPGKGQPSFDKQFVRDYLQSLANEGKWNKEAPAPLLPPAIIQGTTDRYREAYEKLLLKKFS